MSMSPILKKNEQGSRHRWEPGVISVAISGVSNKDNRVCQNMGWDC